MSFRALQEFKAGYAIAPARIADCITGELPMKSRMHVFAALLSLLATKLSAFQSGLQETTGNIEG